MRSRLQLACCQLLFLSTIASSAQTPPTTTDVTMVENQSMDESVEPPAINQYAVAEANFATTLAAMSRAHQATEDEVWKHALEDTSFQSFYQATKEANQVLTRDEAWMEQDKDSLEAWMTTYQLPTLEANHHQTITGTLDEVSKYPMEGSSDPNQGLEASVQDGKTMHQPPTVEANHHHTIDATWTLEDATTETTRPLTWAGDEAWKYALEGSSFQIAASNNVPLEYQDTVEANQAQTLPTWLDQEQATVDVDAPSMMALNALAMNTRNVPLASRRCHSCNIPESPVWHECSDSVFLCDPCCLSLPKFKRVQALAEEKRAELMRLPDNHNHAKGAEKGKGVLPSGAKRKKRGKRIVPPATGRCSRCNKSEFRKWHRVHDGVSIICNACYQRELYHSQHKLEQKNVKLKILERSIEQVPTSYFDVSVSTQSDLAKYGHVASSSTSPQRQLGDFSQFTDNQNHAKDSRNGNGVEESMEPWTTMYQPATAEANRIDATCLLSAVPLSPCVAHTSQRLPPSSYPMIAVSSVPGIPPLQISKSGKPFSNHPMAIKTRKHRDAETSQEREYRLLTNNNRRKAARRARVQEPNQIEGESSQKKRKS